MSFSLGLNCNEDYDIGAMMKKPNIKFFIFLEVILLLFLCITNIYQYYVRKSSINGVDALSINEESEQDSETNKKDYITWVDFNVSSKALKAAYTLDIETYGKPLHLSWIELLAYLGTKYGGDFSKYKEKDLTELSETLLSQEATMQSLTEDMKYYDYYLEAYGAVLGGFVGEYEIQVPISSESKDTDPATEPDSDSESDSETESETISKVWEKRYGLKAYSPIAKGYSYSDYDDFGSSRSYGYKRQHLGHDMMGLVGTPIVAIESGYVEAIGWNQYGGWRLGIRSFDKKRYYYYAHLRQNFPYHKSLKEGGIVQAGDVIGYMGHTGYSTTENVNNIDETHLHWGLQLIFDESQKEGINEIWVDCYQLTRFLSQNRSETVKNPETKDYNRIYQFKDPAAEAAAGS